MLIKLVLQYKTPTLIVLESGGSEKFEDVL